YAASSIYLEWTGRELAVVSGEAVIRVTLADDTALPSIYLRHVVDYVDGRWIGNDELIPTASLTVQQTGSEDNDVLEARSGLGNVLIGLGGDDFIVGAVGSDILSGGSGDDSLAGRAGSDL